MLKNIEKSCAALLAWDSDQYMALSGRTRTLLRRDKERYVNGLAENVEGCLRADAQYRSGRVPVTVRSYKLAFTGYSRFVPASVVITFKDILNGAKTLMCNGTFLLRSSLTSSLVETLRSTFPAFEGWIKKYCVGIMIKAGI